MSGRRHLRQGFVFRPPHAKRAMAETTEATEAAARVSEVEALFKIHGVDQRSSELLYAHPALGGDASPVRLRQDGSDSAAFVPGTSTVIWPCAYSLGDFLYDATAAVRASDDPRRGDPAHAASLGAITPETVVVEVGAGLGLAGLVAARLGAKRVNITDAATARRGRNLEASGLTNATVDELWWQRASWRRARGKAKKRKALDRRTGAPSGADATCASLTSPKPNPTKTNRGRAGRRRRRRACLRSLRPNEDADVTTYPHMIVASDVCYNQGRARCRCWRTRWARCAVRNHRVGDVRGPRRLLLGHFAALLARHGERRPGGDPTPVEEVTVLGEPRTSQRRHNDSERLLLRLRRARETPAE